MATVTKDRCGIPLTTYTYADDITVRNISCGKIMFSQVCVCPRGGEVCTPWADTPLGRHPLGRQPRQANTTPPPPADGYCSGRYASHWNAFLFKNWFAKLKVKITSHGYIFLYLLLHKYLPKSVQ